MAFAARHSLIEEREFHVLHGSLETNKVEGLEHKAYHTVAVIRGLALGQVLDQLARQPVFAGVVVVQDSKDIEQGGFAGAGSAHNGHELAFLNLQVDAFEDVKRLCSKVCFVDVF